MRNRPPNRRRPCPGLRRSTPPCCAPTSARRRPRRGSRTSVRRWRRVPGRIVPGSCRRLRRTQIPRSRPASGLAGASRRTSSRAGWSVGIGAKYAACRRRIGANRNSNPMVAPLSRPNRLLKPPRMKPRRLRLNRCVRSKLPLCRGNLRFVGRLISRNVGCSSCRAESSSSITVPTLAPPRAHTPRATGAPYEIRPRLLFSKDGASLFWAENCERVGPRLTRDVRTYGE